MSVAVELGLDERLWIALRDGVDDHVHVAVDDAVGISVGGGVAEDVGVTVRRIVADNVVLGVTVSTAPQGISRRNVRIIMLERPNGREATPYKRTFAVLAATNSSPLCDRPTQPPTRSR